MTNGKKIVDALSQMDECHRVIGKVKKNLKKILTTFVAKFFTNKQALSQKGINEIPFFGSFFHFRSFE